MASKLECQNLSARPLPAEFLKQAQKLLRRVEKAAGQKFSQVSLVLVTPKRMRQLNYQYRRQAKVTDVLAFIYQPSKPVVGEIVICSWQAARQAQTYQHSLSREMEFLFVHGLLHLLGYDHITLRQERLMKNLAQKVLSA